MKNFINYINEISKRPILPKKAARTTTIILPQLDTTEGIYKSLLPAYVINGTSKDLRILVVGMSDNMIVSNNKKDFHINSDLIAMTDHFVLPFVSFPLRPLIEKIKAAKPGMLFSYYIDANYYLIPEAYPFSKEYKGAVHVEQIEDNIKAVDQVIVTNKKLRDYIIDKLKERHPETKFGTLIYWQQLFILPELMVTAYSNSVEKGKIKALIIGDEYQIPDIKFIAGILTDFKMKYKDAFEINILGWNGVQGNKNHLEKLDFKHYDRVPFQKYFEVIRHIGPDVLLIPANDTKFNESTKNYIKYLEFAQMNIPVIASNTYPYSDLITTNENGFLCDDKEAFGFQLETMFSEPAKFEGALGLAYATANEHSIADEDNIAKLQKIYFPDLNK